MKKERVYLQNSAVPGKGMALAVIICLPVRPGVWRGNSEARIFKTMGRKNPMHNSVPSSEMLGKTAFARYLRQHGDPGWGIPRDMSWEIAMASFLTRSSNAGKEASDG